MITYDELIKDRRRRQAETLDHEHELEDAEFDIEGHKVSGKKCTLCGERFFLMKDLLPIEEELRAKAADAEPITAEDAFLLLAGTYPRIALSGRLVVQKEMFLLEKAFAPEHGLNIEPMGFIPYHLGPYSDRLRRVVRSMHQRGLIEVRPLTGRGGNAYELTERGRRIAEEKKSLIPTDVWAELRRRRRAWDELGSPGLLRIVYQDFSAYAGRSRIREQVEGGPGHEA